MRRRLFNVLTLLSLVLCAGLTCAWVRSMSVGDSFVWGSANASSGVVVYRSVWVRSRSGGISFQREAIVPADPAMTVEEANRRLMRRGWLTDKADRYQYPYAMVLDRTYVHGLGFQIGRFRRPGSVRAGIWVTIPYWLPVLITFAPVYGWVVTYGSRHRARKGACRCCGYDLRATPDRCPECGTAVATRGAAT